MGQKGEADSKKKLEGQTKAVAEGRREQRGGITEVEGRRHLAASHLGSRL